MVGINMRWLNNPPMIFLISSIPLIIGLVIALIVNRWCQKYVWRIVDEIIPHTRNGVSVKPNIILIIRLVIALIVGIMKCLIGELWIWRGPNFIPSLSSPESNSQSGLSGNPLSSQHIWWSDTKNPFFSSQSSSSFWHPAWAQQNSKILKSKLLKIGHCLINDGVGSRSNFAILLCWQNLTNG